MQHQNGNKILAEKYERWENDMESNNVRLLKLPKKRISYIGK